MKINLSEKYQIDIYKNIPYDKEITIKEIKYNVEISRKSFEKTSEKTPGIQADILIQTKNFTYLKNTIFEKFCETYGYNIDTPYHLKYWTYISDNKNIYSGYHIHTNNDEIYLQNTYTWVFYIQMPKNLKNDDGKIFFRTEDEVEHKILPEEGDLIFFPTDLPHRPEINLDAETERIVLAGNLCILDINKEYKKKIKTFI